MLEAGGFGEDEDGFFRRGKQAARERQERGGGSDGAHELAAVEETGHVTLGATEFVIRRKAGDIVYRRRATGTRWFGRRR